MHLHLHLPSRIDMPGDSSLLQRRRLQEVMAQSLQRAVARLNIPHVQIEFLDAGTTQPGSSGVNPAVDSLVHDDLIHFDSFPEVAVLQQEGGGFIHAGGSPYIEVKHLARAFQWGASLFSRNGYAVLQSKRASANQFYVVRLAQHVPLGRVVRGGASIPPQQDYVTVTIVDRDGRAHFRRRASDPWSFVPVEQVLARTPVDQSAMTLPKRISVDQSAMTLPKRISVDQSTMTLPTMHFIAMMDRFLLAEIPWEKRAEYLLLLLHVWTGEREKHAILEIIHSTRSIAELEAIFALLREGGKYTLLFADLDEHVYSLLQMLADFVADYPVDWHYLASLLSDIQIFSVVSSSIRSDPLQELQRAAHELYAWLQNTWADPGFRFTRPDETFIRIEYLAEFLWVVERARQGDLQAQMFVTRMLAQAGTRGIQVLRGLHYAEELGTAYDQRGQGTDSNETLHKQLRSLLLLDVLTWFASLDELRQARQGVDTLTERLAALMNALNSLQPQRVDIPSVAASIGEQLTSSTASEGDTTPQMRGGLQVLLEYTSCDQATILELIENIPPANVQVFLHTMTFVHPFHLEAWEAQTLSELAEHPATLAFIRDAGSALMSATFRRVGHSWEAFEAFLQRLAVKRIRTGNPGDYQWFLRRLSRGEAAAFAEVTAIDLDDVRPGSTEEERTNE